MDQVDAWLEAPAAVTVDPTPTHSTMIRRFLVEIVTGGNLTNNALAPPFAADEPRPGFIADRDPMVV